MTSNNSDKGPKISIITACKNGASFLRETVESIRQQGFTDYEHIFVDGASTDNTMEILKEYKHIKWISEPDRSADEGFYKALWMTCGEYIMLSCISDGYLDRDWFQKCVEVLDNNPDVSMVYGLAQQMAEDGSLGKVVCSVFLDNPPPQKMDFFPFWLGTFNICPESNFCIRANVFKECFPKYECTGHFLQNHALLALNYNFSTKGYLPYFLPVVASYGRFHNDMISIGLTERNRIMREQYRSAIVQYGKEILSGKRKHIFRDGKSNVIRTIEPHELKLYRRKVFDYRVNRKFYLGKKRASGLRYWIRKLRILIGYFIYR